MQLPSYFRDFLKEIRPTQSQIDDYKSGHRTLRNRLHDYEQLSSIIVCTFLQGSYRRATAVRPQADKRPDVDVIVVTKLSQEEFTAQEALNLFKPFLEKYYKGKYEPQGRSFGVSLSYVDLDLVITSAPSESEIGILEADSVITEDTPEDVQDWKLVASWVPLEKRSMPGTWRLLETAKRETEWKLSPLSIPDREAACWEPTHPLAQIQWTWEKNRRCNGHYINVVKALKWWRQINHPTPKYPKGYPVEHLIGQSCPDGITSVAEGVALTLEMIARAYQTDAILQRTPCLPDHGVPEHNVWRRISGEDFAEFHTRVYDAAQTAREALDADNVQESVTGWQKLFGKKFPDAPPDNNNGNGDDSGPKQGGYTPRTNVSRVRGGRFAL